MNHPARATSAMEPASFSFSHPLPFGSLVAPNRVILAPLAGVSDVPFRRICREMGAGLAFVEMLSAEAINRESARTYAMLSRHASERVLGVQVTGPTAEVVARSVDRLDRLGFDHIDINMGCPVRKIVSAGWGAAFLKQPERISETVAAARAATKRPLSVKVRLGYDRAHINVEENARRILDAGADLMTIHGRTRADNYGRAADYARMAAAFSPCRERRPSMALAGNGDVLNLASAWEMVRRTGCDAVMVSRGALGNPWIFRHILRHAPDQPTLEEWSEVVLRHLAYHEEFYGDGLYSARRVRKHLAWYLRGFPRARELRDRLSQVNALGDARRLLHGYCATWPRNLRRYEEVWVDREGDEGPAREPGRDLDREADQALAHDGLPGATAYPPGSATAQSPFPAGRYRPGNSDSSCTSAHPPAIP